jgi:hypothetical protein
VRHTLSAIAFALLIAPAARADELSAGWSRAADGAFTHTQSGVTCPSDIKGYAFKALAGPSAPNFEGICSYDNGQGETGLVRVRRYVEGVGETPLAIQNDYGLMHPTMSNGGRVVGAFRGGPGPVVDGVQTYQIVMTTVAKGYLVDCIARHTEKSMPPSDFPLACMKLEGG